MALPWPKYHLVQQAKIRVTTSATLECNTREDRAHRSEVAQVKIIDKKARTEISASSKSTLIQRASLVESLNLVYATFKGLEILLISNEFYTEL